mmetsp:Transcript_60577/g.131297  ORF Transcript_60577/g.131297 Transcript_60577/m.131297 type:complete len:265 (+) Transcript_60577:32-826(+)
MAEAGSGTGAAARGTLLSQASPDTITLPFEAARGSQQSVPAGDSQDTARTASLETPRQDPSGAVLSSTLGSSSLQNLRLLRRYACFNLGVAVDTHELARRAANTELLANGKVILHALRSPRWVAVVNPSGKVMVSTPYDGQMARNTAKRLARFVQRRLHPQANFRGYRQYLAYVRADLGFRIDLPALVGDITQKVGKGASFFLRYMKRGKDPSAMVEIAPHDGIILKIWQSGRMAAQVVKRPPEDAKSAIEAAATVLAAYKMWW